MSRHSVVKYPTDKLLIFSKTASYIISFVSFFISIAAIVVSLLPPQKPVIVYFVAVVEIIISFSPIDSAMGHSHVCHRSKQL